VRLTFPSGRAVTSLTESAFHVWVHDTTVDADEAVASMAVLSRAERERCARLIFEEDRRDFASGHALVRSVLSVYGRRAATDWTFDTDPFGRPCIAPALVRGDPLQFSLTHTRGLVACGVTSSGAVGVDAVRLDRRAPLSLIGSELFADCEIERLNGLPEPERNHYFLKLWALKEAFAKALGLGMAFRWSEVAFGLDGADVQCSPPPSFPHGYWHAAVYDIAPSYCVAVVARNDRKPPVILTFNSSTPANMSSA
jgi:4'-phosphopantetheinyl transferase